MRNKITALLCVLIAFVTATGANQKPGDKRKSEDAKGNESSVWYNARHGDAEAMNKVGVWYYTGNNLDKDYNQAYQWWLKGALKQNAKAMANLGVCYQYGRGVKRDSTEAIRLYLTAIENGQQELFNQRLSNTPASAFDDMLVGLCYQKGIGTKRNLKSAADIYALAADKGSVDGMIAAAKAYMEAGDNASAKKYLERAAAAGSVEAGYLSANQRIKNNPSETSDHIDKIQAAAESGNADAQALLGQLYQQGKGVSADAQMAAMWLRAAAEGGSADGMWLYGNSLLAERDYDQALFWLSLAAQAGRLDDLAMLLGRLPQTDGFKRYVAGMKAYMVEGNYAKAIDEFQSVGKSKGNIGKVMEMVVLADPKNKKGNPAKAAKELAKLADASAVAAAALAAMNLNGSGVDRDPDRAIALYRTAANSGYGNAQEALAAIYYEGKVTTPDPAGATDLYEKAYSNRALSKEGAQRLIALYQQGQRRRADSPSLQSLANYVGQDPVPATLKALK